MLPTAAFILPSHAVCHDADDACKDDVNDGRSLVGGNLANFRHLRLFIEPGSAHMVAEFRMKLAKGAESHVAYRVSRDRHVVHAASPEVSELRFGVVRAQLALLYSICAQFGGAHQ